MYMHLFIPFVKFAYNGFLYQRDHLLEIELYVHVLIFIRFLTTDFFSRGAIYRRHILLKSQVTCVMKFRNDTSDTSLV